MLAHCVRIAHANGEAGPKGERLRRESRKVTKRSGLKIQPYVALQPAPGFFDGTSVSHRKTAVVLTAALRVHD